MKLGSEECKKALTEYKVKNSMEQLAIVVLLCKAEEVVNLPGLQYMDDDYIDSLAETIKTLRDKIGIEDEA